MLYCQIIIILDISFNSLMEALCMYMYLPEFLLIADDDGPDMDEVRTDFVRRKSVVRCACVRTTQQLLACTVSKQCAVCNNAFYNIHVLL